MVYKVKNSMHIFSKELPFHIHIVVYKLIVYRNAQTRQLSHPLPVLRAREIDEWSRSQEYRTLLQRAIQMNTMQTV